MKTCFKCNRLLPLSDYYAHPQMGDGHLNKCKDCARLDTADEVEAHHEDYTKPIDVIWFCTKHHGEHHAKKREIELLSK